MVALAVRSMCSSSSSSGPHLDDHLQHGSSSSSLPSSQQSPSSSSHCSNFKPQAELTTRRLIRRGEPGTIRGSYSIGEVLGRGTSCVVRELTDRRSGQTYACKIVKLPSAVICECAANCDDRNEDSTTRRPSRRRCSAGCRNDDLDGRSNASDVGGDDNDCDDDDPKPTREKLLQELAIMLATDPNDNIVGLHDYFVQKDKLYLVMESLQGGELLDAVLERGSYPEEDAKETATRLLDAIDHLHMNNIVHRDIKMENCLLKDGRDITSVKLCDFGISRLCDQASEMNRLKTVCGTPLYIAPELVHILGAADDQRDGLTYGPECDMWSFGVLLYIVLAGHPPFPDCHGSVPDLLRNIAVANYNFNDPAWELVTDDAKDLVKRLLTLDPRKRITAFEALSHPWLANHDGKASKRAAARRKAGSDAGVVAATRMSGLLAAAHLTDRPCTRMTI